MTPEEEIDIIEEKGQTRVFISDLTESSFLREVILRGFEVICITKFRDWNVLSPHFILETQILSPPFNFPRESGDSFSIFNEIGYGKGYGFSYGFGDLYYPGFGGSFEYYNQTFIKQWGEN